MTPNPVPAAIPALMRQSPFRVLERLNQDLLRVRKIIRMHQFKATTTSEFLWLVAQHLFQRRTVVLENSVPAENGQHVQRVFRERAEIFFGADQFGFRLLATRPFPGLLQGAAHDQNQPVWTLFENIVGGTVLKPLDGSLLTNRPR